MLKTLMHPGPNGHPRSDTSRPAASAPGRTHDADKSFETGRDAASRSNPKDEGSKLIVGPNIKLKGSEITDCEILVVEGRVEASMNSRDIRIAEGGVFSGRAEIDVAEVRGTFEGDLVARKRLVVYATGRVNGTIRYGAMMVEQGGVISGNVALHSAHAPEKVAAASGPADDAGASNLEILPAARSLGSRAS
ncbi:MAG: polymer-forming cytoskeletal protein [Thiobacillus sp.]|nr:polymer-forming cytoskeletal protein [Thiobacillus sp.]